MAHYHYHREIVVSSKVSLYHYHRENDTSEEWVLGGGDSSLGCYHYHMGGGSISGVVSKEATGVLPLPQGYAD